MSDSTQTKIHVMPLRIYIGVGLSLLCLTGVTVTAYYIDLGHPTRNLIVAILIATIKASLVALFFMHLWYDNKIYMLIFLGAILFLGIFIVFTMFDTMRRDDIYTYRSDNIKKNAPFIQKLREEKAKDNNKESH